LETRTSIIARRIADLPALAREVRKEGRERWVWAGGEGGERGGSHREAVVEESRGFRVCWMVWGLGFRQWRV